MLSSDMKRLHAESSGRSARFKEVLLRLNCLEKDSVQGAMNDMLSRTEAQQAIARVSSSVRKNIKQQIRADSASLMGLVRRHLKESVQKQKAVLKYMGKRVGVVVFVVVWCRCCCGVVLWCGGVGVVV